MSRMVHFVREKLEIGGNENQVSRLSSGLNGTEARAFYESLVAEEFSNNKHNESKDYQTTSTEVTQKVTGHTKNDQTISTEVTQKVTGHTKNDQTISIEVTQKVTGHTKSDQKFQIRECDFLKAAQSGDLKQIKKYLHYGVEIDSEDCFGWTALMCASHDGRRSVVSYLLKKGASVDRVDKCGRNALAIAKMARQEHVVKTIQDFNQNSYNSYTSETKHSLFTDSPSFYCEICDIIIKDSDKKSPSTSTVHVFNLKLKPKQDSFLIPSNNKGYQIMVKSGWDGVQGLGSEGQGKKYPIKTVLKRDRLCLGIDSEKQSKKKAKITHFGANDKKAVRKSNRRIMKSATLNKKAKKAKEEKCKRWERNLRDEMNGFQ